MRIAILYYIPYLFPKSVGVFLMLPTKRVGLRMCSEKNQLGGTIAAKVGRHNCVEHLSIRPCEHRYSVARSFCRAHSFLPRVFTMRLFRVKFLREFFTKCFQNVENKHNIAYFSNEISNGFVWTNSSGAHASVHPLCPYIQWTFNTAT